MLNLTQEEIEKFWHRVSRKSDNECWEWQYYCMNSGYGQFSVRRGIRTFTVSSHRISWVINFGRIPDGLCVLHKCDNKKCCNPNHLFLGTQKDNLMDMVQKGRHVSNKLRGSKNPKSKIKEQNVIEIRKWYKSGKVTKEELVKIFGLCRGSINQIIANKTWKYVEA